MEQIIVNCQGKNTLTVRGNALVVIHKAEEQTFPIQNIQSFSVRKPGLGGCGSIIFKTAQAASFGVKLGFGIGAALGADHAFTFWAEEFDAACRLRDYIAGFIPPDQASDPIAPPPTERQVVSVVEEIRGLKGLLDEGILTQEEFDAKKKQLLGI